MIQLLPQAVPAGALPAPHAFDGRYSNVENRLASPPTRWRHTLAGQTVTIHQHLDGTVSIRYGPHVVGRGKDGSVESVENQTQVSHAFHRPLENSQKRRVSHFSTAPTISPATKTKAQRLA